jgi:lipopolysaccharide biosynthesis protein
MIYGKLLKSLKIIGVFFRKTPQFDSLEFSHKVNHGDLNVIVYAHIYHLSYLKKLKKGLKNFPSSKFLVSTPNLEMKMAAEKVFINRPIGSFQVETVPNRGRNFGPMLNVFASEILMHDILIHVHSKSPNKTIFRYFWSQVLWKDLFLSRKKVIKNFSYFTDSQVGVLSSFSLAWSPPVFSWAGSFEKANSIFPSVTKKYATSSVFLYPIGGMFWARVEAIRPILENLNGYDLFPEESTNLTAIRTGSTTEHVIERLIGIVPESMGFEQIVRVHERRQIVGAQQFLSKMSANS